MANTLSMAALRLCEHRDSMAGWGWQPGTRRRRK